MENPSKKQRVMMHKRNWAIPLILGGILFFSCVGFVLASERLNLNLHARVLVAYWCVVFVFVALLCTYLIKADFSRQTQSRKLELGILYPVSLLLSAIVIERSVFPVPAFFLFLLSWILWAFVNSRNKGTQPSVINTMIISWLVISLTLTAGQFLGFTDDLIEVIWGFSLFLDLRISLSILIITILIIISLGRIDFSKIETEDILTMDDDKGHPLLIILGLFYILVNFMIRMVWWLGLFIMEWGQELVNELKSRSVENRSSLFDLAIILLSIVGLYVALIFAQFLLETYLPINRTVREIFPFIVGLLLVSAILLIAYLIIRFRYLQWQGWTPVLDRNAFDPADRQYREALGFPILTSGIAGIVLFALSHISHFRFEFFSNFGLFSLLLTVGLLISITITFSKSLSKSHN